jgi:N-acyl homoserine lactone hydrolase
MTISLKGVNLGYMGLPKAMLVAKPEYADVVYQCPAIAYIVETPDGRILWDTGISARATEEWLPEWRELVNLSRVPPEVCLEARLKQLGLGPDDFRYVVMSHLHIDHAGGLRLFEDAATEILVHEDELHHVQAMTADAENFFNRVDFFFFDGMPPTTVSGDTIELTGGVSLVSLPGHTPGQMGMVVELGQTGPVLLTSDALYMHNTYGPPDVGTPMSWDAAHWANSMNKIRRLATEREAFIFPGHDEIGIKQFTDRKEIRTIEFWPGYEYE